MYLILTANKDKKNKQTNKMFACDASRATVKEGSPNSSLEKVCSEKTSHN
jgi:hypothetical protein